MKRQRYLWLAVTADKYELPLAVADTAGDLGQMLGITKSTIIIQAKMGLDGTRSGRKLIKVPIGDEDD
jgi:hypothetical protein